MAGRAETGDDEEFGGLSDRQVYVTVGVIVIVVIFVMIWLLF